MRGIPCHAVSVVFSVTLMVPVASAQVPTIVSEIGELESVRDPKCYATANRLEDFIYGTPLDSATRFEKIDLQKAFIRNVWQRAAAAANEDRNKSIDAERLGPILQAVLPIARTEDEGWIVFPDEPARRTEISARDVRQYGSVAYALRAILAVQQDALLDGTPLLPLEPQAVQLFKQSLDLATLAVLQRADFAARAANRRRVAAEDLRSAWRGMVKYERSAPAPKTPVQRQERFATIKAIVEEKLSAFEAYNEIAMPVFLRNLQVYMARYLWPADPEEGSAFRHRFTETMIAWTSDVMLEAEKRARAAGHELIRVTDVEAAVQMYEPHELNEYEDCVYFPRFPKDERIVIEAYDLDSFRDPGLHWVYLSEVLRSPHYEGTLELDPFAAELLTEGAAQMGALILRVAGNVARTEGVQRLNRTHVGKAVVAIQSMLDRHAGLPSEPKGPHSIQSAPPSQHAQQKETQYFTHVTEASGVRFTHRSSDWLSRFIRGYTMVDGNTLRLVVPPAFGGSGIGAEDVDGDGDIDLLILSGSGNALYLNDGKGRFQDVTARSGLAWTRPDGTAGEPRQPIIADFDNDGRQDILMTYVDDDHRLYKGLGDGRFEDVTGRARLGGKGMVGGPAVAFDFDRDGLLDIYIGYFGDYVRGVLPTLSRRNTNALPDMLFRNRGGFVFEDVTAGSGVSNRGWTQAAAHVDFDNDGWQDLICGNDFGVNTWYRNQGNGRFIDVSSTIGTDKPSYTMGIGITDLNRDGYPDVYISNIVTMDKDEKYVLPSTNTRMKFDARKMANMRVVEANDLFVSRPAKEGLPSFFQSEAVGRGYQSTGWSWGAGFFDFDNDGDDDLYVLNGMNEYAVYSSVNAYLADGSGERKTNVMPVAEREANVFFVNRGGRLAEEAQKSGAALTGNSRSAVFFDADGDGDLDMALNNFHAPAAVYRNNAGSANHWITFRLTGDPEKGVSRDAIGARILVRTARHAGLWREVFSSGQYLSSIPREQHLGLGSDDRADVTVLWPNGEREVFKALPANRSHRIVQGGGSPQ